MTESKKITIRKLTPRECIRLMGYTDEEYDRLYEARDANGKQLFSFTSLYKFAGNSVVVDCFMHIGESILKDMDGQKHGQMSLMDYCKDVE